MIIYDDREIVGDEVRRIVGCRRFGDILVKGKKLFEHFKDALPKWAVDKVVHITSNVELVRLREEIESSSEENYLLLVAARAGFEFPARVTQLVERLAFAEEDFTDRLYKPLVVFFRNSHCLLDYYSVLAECPIHKLEKSWKDSQRLLSFQPLDLGNIKDFLHYSTGSTASRHFNEVLVDQYYYTKRSRDKRKMLAEYSFHGLVPESMRPWLIQPFDYRDDGESASYRMLRLHLADAAIQWIHGAFDPQDFSIFIDKLLFFFAQRPRRSCCKNDSDAIATKLFVSKVTHRVEQFLDSEAGKQINRLATAASSTLDVKVLLADYLELYNKNRKLFIGDYLTVGHGDPCFSNVLYDQQRYLLQLIDPRGAILEPEIWSHPLYDLCKISHSVLGDYDFINSGLYRVKFTRENHLVLDIDNGNCSVHKKIFLSRLTQIGHDLVSIRLGEASLFLSMLPLHVDNSNKVLAFMLKAKIIIDEVKNGAIK